VSERQADDLDALGRFPSATPPPPPSAALQKAMGELRPVQTRVPLRTLLVLAAAAAVYPIAAIAVLPLRGDFHALPPLWLGSVALVWLAGFVVPLALAILPRPRQVLPDGVRAGRAALLASLTLVLMGLLFTVDAPGVTIMPPRTWAGFLHPWWHCISFGLRVSVPTVIIGALFFRRVMAASLVRIGAAIGAAAGAIAGLTLHGICQYGGGPHVGLAHGGGVVVGALLGALWLPLLVRATAPRPR
jgi:hypothetical protein